MVLGLASALLFATVPYAVHGCLFYAFSQVSHVQRECQSPEAKQLLLEQQHHQQHQQDQQHKQPPQPQPQQAEKEGKEAGDGKDVKGKEEWAVHQVGHAMDYAVDSTLWLHASNGLNLQAIHHLFPQVAWEHYTTLVSIVYVYIYLIAQLFVVVEL